MSRIDAQPTAGLSYSPVEEKYWDPQGLADEMTRIYDICHGCRLCFNLCPSFPFLFDAVDKYDGDVTKLTDGERQEVVDLCWGCKLCHIKCPYTPEDGHEFLIDFPALMLRARAQKTRTHGTPLRDKILGDPDRMGKMARLGPGLANWVNKIRPNRVLVEKVMGIHRDKKLPEFVAETFRKWFSRNPPKKPAEPAAKVAVFHTCFVNYNNAEPGKAVVKILEKNDCEVTCPEQNCCGMPALDSGNVAFAQKQARSNIEKLLPLVREGYKIAAVNPTCSMTMRKEYPRLLGTDDARELAAAVVDPHELLFGLKKEGKLNRDFKSTPGHVAYHIPCHLKAQGIGFRSRDIMKLIPGSKITMIDACTAHDGTWAMKKEYFELSMKWGKKAFDGVTDAKPDVVAGDCPLAAVQIEQGTGIRPIHPAEVIARAYEPDGFPTPVPEETE